MRDGQDHVGEAGARRGELHAELCGSVYGCEYDGAEAFGEFEESGDVKRGLGRGGSVWLETGIGVCWMRGDGGG